VWPPGFGAAGSLIVVFVWVHFSAQIFLIGAEFPWVYATTFGSMRKLEAKPDDKTAAELPNAVAAPAPAAVPTAPSDAAPPPIPATNEATTPVHMGVALAAGMALGWCC
jgi:membrane protein